MGNIWGTLAFETHDTKYFKIGELHLWIRVQDGEIWVAHLYDKERQMSEEEIKVPPEDIIWSRWALKNPTEDIEIVPAFADLPLVIHPEYPLQIASGAHIQIYTRVSLWVRIQTAGKNPYVIQELPTVIYSKTWFGSPFEGELCYATTTKARRKLPAETYKNHLINCGIQVHNKASENLDFGKFCFRVERLDIFEKEGVFWANDTTIIFRGEEQLSDIRMSDHIPESARGGKKITAARKPESRGLASRTFHKLINEISIIGR